MKRISAFLAAVLLIVFSISFAFAYNGNTTVYVTNTGECYHVSGCSYLKSKNAISLEDAVDQGYRACSRCHPPALSAQNDSSPSRSIPSYSYSQPSYSPSASSSTSSPPSTSSNASGSPSTSSNAASSDDTDVVFPIVASFLALVIVCFAFARPKKSGKSPAPQGKTAQILSDLESLTPDQLDHVAKYIKFIKMNK